MGKVFVSFVALFSALGAYLSGYSIGSVNGIQNFVGFVETLFNQTANEPSSLFNVSQGNSTAGTGSEFCSATDVTLAGADLVLLGTFVSIVNLGGAIGNLFAGKPTDYFGRKVSLLISGVLVILGGSIQSAAISIWMLIFGRLIDGIGYGLFYMAGPVYIAEIAPKSIRGRLTSLIGPTIALGILTGYISNYGLSQFEGGWRIARLLTCVFASVYVIGMSFLPRTPRWLMLKGRETEAREVLRKVTSNNQEGLDTIESEIRDIKESLDSHTNPTFVRELMLMLKWRNLKRVLVGVPLHILSASCGTAIFFYSEPLFCTLGVVPFVSAIVIGIVTLCATIFTTFTIDKFGRKPMMVGGGLLMAILSATAASLVYVFNLEEENDPIVGYVVVALVCSFMLVYASTWYVIPWIVTSEIFSLEGRGIAVAISTAMNWGFGFTFTQAFPHILTSLNSFGTLYLIAFIDLLAALFFLFFLPETKGISLEDMDKLFAKPWLIRVGLSCHSRRGRLRMPVSDANHSQHAATNGIVRNVDGDKKEEKASEADLPQARNRLHSVLGDGREWEYYWKGYEEEMKDEEMRATGKETDV